MANRQIIRDLINKYCTKQYISETHELIKPSIEWNTWSSVPALVEPATFHFRFEGAFVDKITTLEAKILALHEIAHYNSFMTGTDSYGHGDPINELSFYSLFGQEKIRYNQVNSAIKSIHRKFAQYSKR